MYAAIKLSYRRVDLEKQMMRYLSISKRLEKYYCNTFATIVERAIIRGEKLSKTI